MTPSKERQIYAYLRGSADVFPQGKCCVTFPPDARPSIEALKNHGLLTTGKTSSGRWYSVGNPKARRKDLRPLTDAELDVLDNMSISVTGFDSGKATP